MVRTMISTIPSTTRVTAVVAVHAPVRIWLVFSVIRDWVSAQALSIASVSSAGFRPKGRSMAWSWSTALLTLSTRSSKPATAGVTIRVMAAL